MGRTKEREGGSVATVCGCKIPPFATHNRQYTEFTRITEMMSTGLATVYLA